MQLKLKDKIWLYTQLTTFSRAGFGIDQGLRSMLEHANSPNRTRFLEHARHLVRSGSTLGEAFEYPEARVTPMEITIIRASEMAGMLEQGFAHLAEHFEAVQRMRRQILPQLLYPAVLVHLGILLPAIPRYVRTQDLVGTLGIAIVMLATVYAMTFALVLAYRILSRQAGHALSADRFLRRLPLIGGLRKSEALQRFCSVMRMYIECGQKISTGAAAGGEASASAVVNDAGNRLAETARGGAPMGSVILTLHEAFPHDLGSAIHNAEQSGMLSEELSRWAKLYREGVQSQCQLVAAWLPRLIYAIVAVFVVWQIFSMLGDVYRPVFEMIDNL